MIEENDKGMTKWELFTYLLIGLLTGTWTVMIINILTDLIF